MIYNDKTIISFFILDFITAFIIILFSYFVVWFFSHSVISVHSVISAFIYGEWHLPGIISSTILSFGQACQCYRVEVDINDNIDNVIKHATKKNLSITVKNNTLIITKKMLKLLNKKISINYIIIGNTFKIYGKRRDINEFIKIIDSKKNTSLISK